MAASSDADGGGRAANNSTEDGHGHGHGQGNNSGKVYSQEHARMEAWLDEHPEFFQVIPKVSLTTCEKIFTFHHCRTI